MHTLIPFLSLSPRIIGKKVNIVPISSFRLCDNTNKKKKKRKRTKERKKGRKEAAWFSATKLSAIPLKEKVTIFLLEFRLSILFGGQSSANALHSIRGEKEEEKSITFLWFNYPVVNGVAFSKRIRPIVSRKKKRRKKNIALKFINRSKRCCEMKNRCGMLLAFKRVYY